MSLCAKFHTFVPICAMVQLTALTIQHRRHRRVSTNNVARIRSKSIEKRVLVVKTVLSLRKK